MAMDQAERDKRRREKAERLQEEDLRFKVRPGTKQSLMELMKWAGIEEQGEAMTLMIHHIEALGHHALFRIARHEIEAHQDVAQTEPLRLSARKRTGQHLRAICGWADATYSQMIEALIHGITPWAACTRRSFSPRQSTKSAYRRALLWPSTERAC